MNHVAFALLVAWAAAPEPDAVKKKLEVSLPKEWTVTSVTVVEPLVVLSAEFDSYEANAIFSAKTKSVQVFLAQKPGGNLAMTALFPSDGAVTIACLPGHEGK